MALASGLVVGTVSLTINTAITWQLPYACHGVAIKSPSVVPGGPGARHLRLTSDGGGNETACSITAQPWWVEGSGIAGFFTGGIEGILVLRRRRGERGGEVMQAGVPVAA
jgi:hypothetical protein